MDKTAGGWINGFLGVLIFSGSLPATRVAVANFDPLFLTVARAAIAGVLAFCLLLAFREKRPERTDLLCWRSYRSASSLAFRYSPRLR